MENENKKYEINRSLPIRHDDLTGKLRFGFLSPLSVEIMSDVELIIPLLDFLQTAKTQNEIIEFLKQHLLNKNQAEDLYADLKTLGVLQEALDVKGRYHRHQLYFSHFGLDTFQYHHALKEKSVLIVGVGGIGSCGAQLLNAAGVGTLILCDDDHVEVSNLTRTVLFTENDIGMLKIEAAQKRLLERNASTKIVNFAQKISSENLSELEKIFEQADFALVSGDSGPEVHCIVNEMSKKFAVPYLNAGYIETFGVVGPLIHAAIENNFFEKEMMSESTRTALQPELNRHLQAPSYGPLNHMVASFAVNEIIRYFLGLPLQTAEHRLLLNSENYQITFKSTQENIFREAV